MDVRYHCINNGYSYRRPRCCSFVCPPHVVLHRNYRLRQQIGLVMFLPAVDQPSNIIQGIFTSRGIILPGAQHKHVHSVSMCTCIWLGSQINLCCSFGPIFALGFIVFTLNWLANYSQCFGDIATCFSKSRTDTTISRCQSGHNLLSQWREEWDCSKPVPQPLHSSSPTLLTTKPGVTVCEGYKNLLMTPYKVPVLHIGYCSWYFAHGH